MPFKFGFEAEDDDDEDTLQSPSQRDGVNAPEERQDPPVDAKHHSLRDLLATLPSRIAYSTIEITSPDGRAVAIPRRELFDVRIQLMAEDENLETPSPSSANVLGHLRDEDIQTNVYEGGLKSWECSIDLARVLLENETYINDLGRPGSHILELGAGTALPTLTVFQQILRHNTKAIHVTVSDYNLDVIRLVSIPNVFLSWVMVTKFDSLASPWVEQSDIEVSSHLIEEFIADLDSKNFTIDAISGAWSRQFLDILSDTCHPQYRLVLASETIYSPASLEPFTRVLIGSLGERTDWRALVAAKRFYFGVGGSVDGFKFKLGEHGRVGTEIGDAGDHGVSRVVLEVSSYQPLQKDLGD